MWVRRSRSAGRQMEEEIRSGGLVLASDGPFDAGSDEGAWAAFCMTQQLALPVAADQPPAAGPAPLPAPAEVGPEVLPSDVPVIDLVQPSAVEAARPARPVGGDAMEAAVLFRQGAVALAGREGDPDTRAEARQCAGALLQLAASGEEDLLSSHLLPHPGRTECTWTVACYQIGDLSPTSLRDFPEAVPAVSHLAGCETRSHVAAELIAASSDGIRWTALVRSGAEVRFQPFHHSTATADTPALVHGARQTWEDRLQRWERDPAGDLISVSPAATAPAFPDTHRLDSAVGQILEAVVRIDSRLAAGDGLAARVAELEAAQREAAAEIAILRAELRRVSRPSRGMQHARRTRRRLGWLT